MIYFKAKCQLGNLMLEYAAALSHCKLGELPGVIAGEERSIKIINSHHDLFGKPVIRHTVPSDAFCWEETQVPYVEIPEREGDMVLDGVFFSEKYFNKDLIRARYSPTGKMIDYLNGKYGDWLKRPNVTGIHVRRGDYMKCQFDFPFAGKNYYKSAISRLADCDDFIVCSDDIKWCKQFFTRTFPKKRFLFSEGNTPLQDMYLLSLCKNNIISNGSFAWWGAWLNKNPSKRVLAPSMWFGFAVPKERVNPRDIYFNGTEIVQNTYDFCDWLRSHFDAFQLSIRKKVNPLVRVVRNIIRNFKKYRYVSKRICNGFAHITRANLCELRWDTFVRKDDGKLIKLNPGKHKWHRQFVADPFLFQHEGTNWLFYETTDENWVGKIGCFKEEGNRWVQKGIVLERPWHMSYPQVFSEDGHIYMIPEQSDHGRGNVALYEAVDFPFRWELKKVLIECPFADSTLLKKDGYYYMACYTIPPNESAELWCAPSLEGLWTRHPEWRNINQSARLRRCGGSFLVENGELFRVAQDCNRTYGKRLFKVKVEEISPSRYKEGSATLLLDRNTWPHRFKHTYNEVGAGSKKVITFDSYYYHILPPGKLIKGFGGLLRSLISRVIRLKRK